MKITLLAARLRIVAKGLEALAVRQGDAEIPEYAIAEFVQGAIEDKVLLAPSTEHCGIPLVRIPRP